MPRWESLACGWAARRRKTLPENLRGECCAPLRALPPAQLLDLLHQAAQRAFAEQGGSVPGPRPAGRLGAIAVGGPLPRPGLQTQRLGHAAPGRAAPALADAPGPAAGPAGAPVRHQRPAAGGIDPLAGGGGPLCPPRLGPVVAGARRIRRLHPAAGTLAPPRVAARQPPAAPPGARLALVGGGRPGGEAGTVVCARGARIRPSPIPCWRH